MMNYYILYHSHLGRVCLLLMYYIDVCLLLYYMYVRMMGRMCMMGTMCVGCIGVAAGYIDGVLI